MQSLLVAQHNNYPRMNTDKWAMWSEEMSTMHWLLATNSTTYLCAVRGRIIIISTMILCRTPDTATLASPLLKYVAWRADLCWHCYIHPVSNGKVCTAVAHTTASMRDGIDNPSKPHEAQQCWSSSAISRQLTRYLPHHPSQLQPLAQTYTDS